MKLQVLIDDHHKLQEKQIEDWIVGITVYEDLEAVPASELGVLQTECDFFSNNPNENR